MGLFFNVPPICELRPDPASNPNVGRVIVFQFQPTSFVTNVGAVWSSANAQNRDHPILQFSRGSQKSLTFEAKMYAETTSDDIDTQVDILINSMNRAPELRRPIVWQFVWGNVINELVVIESVGNIRYDELRPDGTARGVLFGISLLKYVPFDIVLTDPNAPEIGTFYTYPKEGDHWEHMALREYGDPLFGDLIRRRYPEIRQPGDEPQFVVSLPPIDIIRKESLEPSSGPLRRTEEGLKARQEIYALRSKSRPSAVIVK